MERHGDYEPSDWDTHINPFEQEPIFNKENLLTEIERELEMLERKRLHLLELKEQLNES